MTRRAASLLLSIAVLLALSLTPVVSQDETTPEAPPPPPYSDGALVQLVKFFSPSCGHCHKVITETLPPLYEAHGGTPVTMHDESISPDDVSYYLMTNGQLQILFVDTTTDAGQGVFQADNIRLDIESAGVPRMDIEDFYLVGSADIPDQLPGIVAEGLAGDGIGWPDVPGLAAALAPFIELGLVPELEPAEAPDDEDVPADDEEPAA